VCVAISWNTYSSANTTVNTPWKEALSGGGKRMFFWILSCVLLVSLVNVSIWMQQLQSFVVLWGQHLLLQWERLWWMNEQRTKQSNS
jgi:hypothetical protein